MATLAGWLEGQIVYDLAGRPGLWRLVAPVTVRTLAAIRPGSIVLAVLGQTLAEFVCVAGSEI